MTHPHFAFTVTQTVVTEHVANNAKRGWLYIGPCLTLIPILASTFVDPFLRAHPTETPKELT